MEEAVAVVISLVQTLACTLHRRIKDPQERFDMQARKLVYDALKLSNFGVVPGRTLTQLPIPAPHSSMHGAQGMAMDAFRTNNGIGYANHARTSPFPAHHSGGDSIGDDITIAQPSVGIDVMQMSSASAHHAEEALPYNPTTNHASHDDHIAARHSSMMRHAIQEAPYAPGSPPSAEDVWDGFEGSWPTIGIHTSNMPSRGNVNSPTISALGGGQTSHEAAQDDSTLVSNFHRDLGNVLQETQSRSSEAQIASVSTAHMRVNNIAGHRGLDGLGDEDKENNPPPLHQDVSILDDRAFDLDAGFSG